MTIIDVEALLRKTRVEPGPRCETCKWIDSRPADEQKKWDEAFQNGRWDAANIERAIGLVPDDSVKKPGRLSVQKHRKNKHREQT